MFCDQSLSAQAHTLFPCARLSWRKTVAPVKRFPNDSSLEHVSCAIPPSLVQVPCIIHGSLYSVCSIFCFLHLCFAIKSYCFCYLTFLSCMIYSQPTLQQLLLSPGTGTAVKQEATGSLTQSSHVSMAAVKQEPDSCTQPAINLTCTCGGNATRCSAPGCHQLHCQPCDMVLKATDPAKCFETCSFHCCMPRKGFSKAQFCPAHHSLLFNCMVCQQVFCKRPCCSQCRLAVCQHCIDSHKEALWWQHTVKWRCNISGIRVH